MAFTQITCWHNISHEKTAKMSRTAPLLIIGSFQTLVVLGHYQPGLCSHSHISKRDFKQRNTFFTIPTYCHTGKWPGYLTKHLCSSNFIISDGIIVQIIHTQMCTNANSGTHKLFKSLGEGGKPYQCAIPKLKNTHLKQGRQNLNLVGPCQNLQPLIAWGHLKPFQRGHQAGRQDKNKSLVRFFLSDSLIWQPSLPKSNPKGCVFSPRSRSY